jgi:hydrogenase expression/formation protein HypE
MLGLDPLYLACEGRLVAFVGEQAAEAVLARMQEHPFGRESVLIGRVVTDDTGTVVMRTVLGSERRIDSLSGAQLPRIC